MNIKPLYYFFFFVTSVFFAQENVLEVGIMPEEVTETSGLLFYNGKIITHNDSGNAPQLFEIDTLTMEITRTVTISNAINEDWEDIAQDDMYIYIADFGNFNGDRLNLTIYRIAKSDYDQSDTITAEQIEFTYEDQTDFTSSPNSDWDAEALFVFNEELIILTKQWQGNGTTAYSLPKSIGTQIARNIGSYNTAGLITGATYNTQTETLFLVGYTQFLGPFVTNVQGLTANSIFNGTVDRTNLNIGFAQVEGITHIGPNKYFVSSEFFSNASPAITSESRLFTFELENAPVEEEEPEIPENMGEEEGLVIFRSFGSQLLEYEFPTQETIFGRAIFDTSGRRIRYTNAADFEGNSIDLSTLGTSVYYLTFYLRNGVVSKPFVAN